MVKETKTGLLTVEPLVGIGATTSTTDLIVDSEPYHLTQTNLERRIVHYQHARFVYFPNEREVLHDGETSHLTKSENRLMAILVASSIVTPRDFAEIFWGLESAAVDIHTRFYATNSLRTYIGVLREKLGDKASMQVIVSVRGKGYKLADPAERVEIVSPREPELVFSHPLFNYFPESRTVEVNGQKSRLNAGEHTLLSTFIRHPDVPLGIDQLRSGGISKPNLQNKVWTLRKKLDPDGTGQGLQVLATVMGFGYRFNTLAEGAA